MRFKNFFSVGILKSNGILKEFYKTDTLENHIRLFYEVKRV